MKIGYSVYDPNGNITVLVKTPVPSDLRLSVSRFLLSAEPSAEQVGFLSQGDPHAFDIALRMAGGEFCGNASLSAALAYFENEKKNGEKIRVLCSGADLPVEVGLAPSGGSFFRGRVKMPPPFSVKSRDLPLRDGTVTLPVVEMPGISHVIVTGKKDLPAFSPREVIALWCGLLSVPSLGLLFFEPESGKMTPYVYVEKGETFYRESACASGTAAVGYYLFRKTGAPVSLRLTEPMGAMEVSVSSGGEVHIGGTVRKIAEKTVDFDLT